VELAAFIRLAVPGTIFQKKSVGKPPLTDFCPAHFACDVENQDPTLSTIASDQSTTQADLAGTAKKNEDFRAVIR